MQAAPAFTHLTLTGGAIGCGPPLAVGAALAQPRSVVINIQVGRESGLTAAQRAWVTNRASKHNYNMFKFAG